MDLRRARVMVVNQRPDVRRALVATLADRFDVVAAVGDAGAASAVAHLLRPDVAVVEGARLGRGLSEPLRRLIATGSPRFLILSDDTDHQRVRSALSLGAAAVVSTHQLGHVPAAIDHVLAGRMVVPSAAVLPAWDRQGVTPHDLHVYADDRELADSVTNLFVAALEIGQSIAAIASKTHLELLADVLQSGGVDTAALQRSGRYGVMDSSLALDAVMQNGSPNPAVLTSHLEALVERGIAAAAGAVPRVTIFGEIAPILCARGDFKGMATIERTADDFASSRPVSILCGYASACVGPPGGAVRENVCAGHSAIVTLH